MLAVGDLAPKVRIRDPAGRAVTIPDERGGTTVLLFVHPAPCAACEDYAATLTSARDRLSAWDARVFLVGEGWRGQELGVEDRGLRASYGLADMDAAVVVADRFGQIFAAWDAASDHQFPDALGPVLEEARFLGVQCPECDVDDVPPGLRGV